MDSSFLETISVNTMLGAFALTLSLGSLLGWLAYRAYKNSVRKGAETDAQEIVQSAKDRLEVQDLEEKEQFADIESQLWSKVEEDHANLEEKIEDLEDRHREIAAKNDLALKREQSRIEGLESDLKKQQSQVQSKEQKLSNVKKSLEQLTQQVLAKLLEKVGVEKSSLLNEVTQKLIEESEKVANRTIKESEESHLAHAESMAKEILSKVIDRFQRPYCSERGITPVFFQNHNDRTKFKDPKVVEAIEELCGCDIHIETDTEQIGVAGFDPVRRELTHRVLEKILTEKRPMTVNLVSQIIGNCRKDLVRQIRSDGDQLARELRLEGLHPEIRQMMGSLRYRYSFTQNQHFHCAEVGWLCGLLASELGENIKSARRSGMLHDLGKSMDHAKEGGHAVIGADFIQERGEKTEIVHAVRAHHYDIQPDSNLAYLVIGADAISGGRPGARRSAVESYNQKVNELDQIAKSFHGVTDCFVLNGGREVRILVNSKQVDDQKALKISQEMAKRVEEECNYPGQIKIVVVRETHAVESTR